jgi:hypothetical protein
LVPIVTLLSRLKTPGSCTSGAPGNTPQITSAVANGVSQITLTWTAAADPVTYYLLAYGLTSGQYIYGNPNIGGHDTTSYSVGNLAKGTSYYFAIKAVNVCNPGGFSNEISATTTGGIVAVPVTSTDTSSNNQDAITPTDTPIPATPTTEPTATPKPVQVSAAGISKTQLLIYILIFIIAVGGIGNFIYWKHKKNTKKSVEIFDNEQEKNP